MTRTELEMEFAGAALGWVERELEMTDPEIGQTLGVDRKTIYRWRKRESAPAPEQRKRMEKLTQLKMVPGKLVSNGSSGQTMAPSTRSGLAGADANVCPHCGRHRRRAWCARHARVRGSRLSKPPRERTRPTL
jgi:hypothetical protein